MRRLPPAAWAVALALLAALACTSDHCQVAFEGRPASSERSACCPDGRSACAGGCSDLETDPSHCGACGRACAPSETCAQGRCGCEAGQTFCPIDGCVDTRRDPSHCGACGRACQRMEACVDGDCACANGGIHCGAIGCVDLNGDTAHCGACGRACPAGERCASGACACPDGAVRCGRACVDTQGDRAHCGACGRACASSQACQGGHCVTACPAGRGACAVDGPRVCDVDLTASLEHCGACFHRCRAGEVCRAGRCACEGAAACTPARYAAVPAWRCPADGGPSGCPLAPGAASACDGERCVYHCLPDRGRCDDAAPPGCATSLETLTDCGACGHRCARGERCAGGACGCLPGQSRCGDACVSLRAHTAHCGACDAACPAGEACDAGRCVARATPRPVAPPSGAVLGTRRPTFRWLPARGENTTRVELCRERSCADPLATLVAAGDAATPADDLPAGTLFWRVRGVRDDGATGAPSATWPLRLHGPPGARGGVLGHTADFNGDGLADLALRDGLRPRVCLYFGRASGLRPGGCPSLRGADGVARAVGPSLALGDFDGDGFTDLAARSGDIGPAPVVALRGGPAGPTRVEEWWDPDGPWPFPARDADLYGVGDVDDDGYADLAVYRDGLVGAPIEVHSGGPEGRRWLPRHVLTVPGGEDPVFGGAVHNVGDLDGDERGDLVVEPRPGPQMGSLLVYLGAAAGPSDAPAARLVAASGERAALAGDFDGDGVGDLAVIAAGRLVTYRGAPGGPSPAPSARVAWAGVDAAWATSFDGARDLDGDGHADVVARSEGDASAWLLHRGSARGLEDVRYGPLLGRGVHWIRWLGDVNGDGRDDVAVFVADALQVYLGAADGLPPSPSQTLPWPIAP